MSDRHFGMVYPPVYWTAHDYDYELPEPTEAANIEGTLLVNAEEVEQIRRLKDENAKLRKENERLIIKLKAEHIVRQNVVSENANLRELCERCAIELYANGNVTDAATENLFDDMRKLGIEVDS